MQALGLPQPQSCNLINTNGNNNERIHKITVIFTYSIMLMRDASLQYAQLSHSEHAMLRVTFIQR